MKTTETRSMIIAEFMGLKRYDAYPVLWREGNDDVYRGYFIPYNCDYKWLMPAYAKFSDLGKTFRHNKSTGKIIPLYQIYWKQYLFMLQEEILSTNIQKAFEILADGIEWYNENKKEIEEQLK